MARGNGDWALAENDDRRRIARWRTTARAMIKRPCLRPLAVELYDISSDGCGFFSDCAFAPGTRLLIDLPGLEIWSATVIWCERGRVGARFSRPMHPVVAERFAIS
jgi:hypothetical protein